MKKKQRHFISLYFHDGLTQLRKKRDVTLAFDEKDYLYGLCRTLGSAGIKRIIGISSYSTLAEKAKKEGRPLSNYVKHLLRMRLNK